MIVKQIIVCPLFIGGLVCEVFVTYDPDVVRMFNLKVRKLTYINKGKYTKTLTKETGLLIHVIVPKIDFLFRFFQCVRKLLKQNNKN